MKTIMNTLILTLALLNVGTAAAQQVTGIVTQVEDGDSLTLTVDTIHYPIKLADIDAPEICPVHRDPACNKRSQPGGHEAADRLRALALGQQATAVCRGVSDARNLCYVFVGKKHLNKVLAVEGHAWWDARLGRDRGIRDVEDYARRAQIGLWRNNQAVHPETWRRVCWSSRPDVGMCGNAGW